jgi:hypothetical protein
VVNDFTLIKFSSMYALVLPYNQSVV